MSEQPVPPGQPEQPGPPGQPDPSQSGSSQSGSSQPGQPAGAPAKRLVRSRTDRMLGGVCGGVAEYLGVDATLVRILVVVGTVLGLGSLVLAYIAGWILIPEED